MDLSGFTDFSWLASEGLLRLPDFLTSLGIGLLVGLERERNPSARAGLRTFALVSLLGTVCGVLSQAQGAPWLSVVGLLVVGAMIIAAYLDAALHRPAEAQDDPGTTTSAALVLCFALGTLVAYGSARIAVMLAIITTALLYLKPELKGWAQSLQRSDLRSILQFAVVSFIVLPVLPDRNFGPYSALNLQQVWLMVVLISGVSLAGYVALRIVGRRYGAALLGLLGGLVSSTATTLVYARQGRSNPEMCDLSVAVILLANLVVLGRLSLLTAVVSPGLLHSALPVFGCGVVAGLGLVAYRLRWRQGHDEPPMPVISNPTELRSAIVFALLYGLVLLLSAWLHDKAGATGLYAVALVSGLADVDAITLSSLRLFGLGELAARPAVTAITFAFLANIAFKLGLIAFAGGMDMLRRCLPGLAFTAVGAGAGLILFA
jgi:uncharacterized membrane protein (DUF4010 family)